MACAARQPLHRTKPPSWHLPDSDCCFLRIPCLSSLLDHPPPNAHLYSSLLCSFLPLPLSSSSLRSCPLERSSSSLPLTSPSQCRQLYLANATQRRAAAKDVRDWPPRCCVSARRRLAGGGAANSGEQAAAGLVQSFTAPLLCIVWTASFQTGAASGVGTAERHGARLPGGCCGL